jgi:small subunit ribosomal protein S17
MSNIWNFKDPLKCGFIRLAPGGREKYGTVIKSGFMKKTVTVMVDQMIYNTKYKVYTRRSTKFQVHDQDEICRTGDKVIIKVCHPLSKLKHYYIRNLIWMTPRHNFTVDKFLNFEKRAMLYNTSIRNASDFQDFTGEEKV